MLSVVVEASGRQAHGEHPGSYPPPLIFLRMSLIRHRRRTFLLYKETGKQKWAGMLVETGKIFVDLSAMMTQMRED